MIDKKLILYIYISIMLIILIVSSTNIFLDENYKRVYDISIIFNDEDSDKFDKLKMGIEDSVVDFSADVNFIYLENKWDVNEQKEAILKEMDYGTDGIIILPVDSKDIGEFLDEISTNIPIISVGEYINSKNVKGYVGGDLKSIGNKLGDFLSNKNSGQTVVAFLEEDRESQIYDSMETIFKDNGLFIEMIDYSEATFQNLVKSYDRYNTTFVALDVDTTNKFITDFIDKDIYMNVYGMGYTNDLIQYLNLGKVQALSIYDEYLTGYLSVRNLIYSIDGKKINKIEIVPDYLVKQGQVYDYEKVLFPID